LADPADHIEAHVLIESPEDSSVDLLQQSTGLSKQRIEHVMTQGAVWITRGRSTQRLRRAKRALRVGDEIHLYYDARILAEIPPEPTLVADIGGYRSPFRPGRHLAELGYPIIGDRMYGVSDEDGVDLHLTAYLLAFRCPVNDERAQYRL